MKRQINLDDIVFTIWSEAVDKFKRYNENGTCYMKCKEETYKQFLKDLTFRELAYYMDTVKADLMAECEYLEYWEEKNEK